MVLTLKEQKRLKVNPDMASGEMKDLEAASVLGLSVGQVTRLMAGYRKKGAARLAHGNRGRVPHDKMAEQVREEY